MLQVFLDANTYLGFYSLTPADVAELDKVVELVKIGKIRLLVPSQVADEVRRNRAKVLTERLKPLKDARVQVPIPPMVDKTPAATALKKAFAETQKAHTKLLAELLQGVQQETLPADKLIGNLFAQGTKINEAAAVPAAQLRKALGNPPGKGSSIGDGVNWETILVHGNNLEELHFVSADGDFASVLDPTVFDEFLAAEWEREKLSRIRFYRDIKSFLDTTFPSIRLASDVRKYFLIDELVGSESFAGTHTTVAELDRYDSFSIDEAFRLLNGGLENTQVRWLAQDEDVRKLIRKVLDPHRVALPKLLVDQWEYLTSGRGYSYGSVPTQAEIYAPPKGTSSA
jgi:hypothetical protein